MIAGRMDHSGHEILKCRICLTVVAQCRCITPGKKVRLTTCAECKKSLGE